MGEYLHDLEVGSNFLNKRELSIEEKVVTALCKKCRTLRSSQGITEGGKTQATKGKMVSATTNACVTND